MVFKVKKEGYYKVNNESNWTKHEENDVILESDINVINHVYYLKPSTESLEEATINIVPRWWML